jgi:hypothetical protein
MRLKAAEQKTAGVKKRRLAGAYTRRGMFSVLSAAPGVGVNAASSARPIETFLKKQRAGYSYPPLK